MKKLLLVIFSIYGFLVFLLLMLVIFPFVIIASFFGSIQGGNMIYHICRFWADAAFFCWGIFHANIYEAEPAKNHAVVFVFNHTSYIDIPVLLKTFRKQKIRILAKSSMAKIPIFGFIYRKAAILVDRSSPEARSKSLASMKTYLTNNISIVIAPEGTFNLTDKPLKEFYDGAFKTAIEMQLSIQPVVFPDAYDRLHPGSIFSLNPGKTTAVFLPEFNTIGYTLENLEALKQNIYNTMEDALLRYKASWIK